jgi:hypothetical protein
LLDKLGSQLLLPVFDKRKGSPRGNMILDGELKVF